MISNSSVPPKPKAKNSAKFDNGAPCCTINVTQPIEACSADYASTSSANSNLGPSPSLDCSRCQTGSSVSQATKTPPQTECQSTQRRAIEMVCSSEDEVKKPDFSPTASEGRFPQRGRRKEKYKLSANETSAELENELRELRKFITSP